MVSYKVILEGVSMVEEEGSPLLTTGMCLVAKALMKATEREALFYSMWASLEGVGP